jgi:ADP-heptose:LPS heptosyltransferase
MPNVEVVPSSSDLHAGAAAEQVCLTSLGQFFRPDASSFPSRHGFLVPDAERVASLRARITGGGRPAIGLSWSSPKAQFAQSKSASLLDFSGLVGKVDANWIDLQYGDTAAERERFAQQAGIAISHLDDIDNTNDIDGLAALIAACDLVVTVSNTTAHVAGAVGTPAWVLVPFGHSRMWYWHPGRDDNPWYPNVRIRPQRMGQSWRDLIESVTDEISTFASAAGAGTT